MLLSLADNLQQLGLNPFHLTLAVDRNVEDPKHSPCIRCATCDPYPCKIDAKLDAQKACVDPATEYNNVELKINALVTKLITDDSGKKIQAVEVEIDREGRSGFATSPNRGIEGNKERYTADIFVLSCGSINSAALLLKSANEKHPNGLANSSGMVGRNLMLHNHSALIAIADSSNPTVFQKTLGFNDFYFGSPEHDYPLGQVQLTGKSKWNRLAIFSPRLGSPNYFKISGRTLCRLVVN